MTTALLLALALAADPRVRLTELESRKAAERAAAKQLAARERSVLDTLEGAERSWRDAEVRAAETEAERQSSAERLAHARSEEEAAVQRHQALSARLRPRLAALQTLTRAGELRMLASAPDLADLVKRRTMLQRVVAGDVAALREAAAALAESERLTVLRASEAERLDALASEAERQRAEAEQRRNAFRASLAVVRGERALRERAATEAEAQAAKLSRFVGELPSSRGEGAPYKGFASLHGQMRMPAGSRIQGGFGKVVDPRSGTVTIQKGVDIAARRGEEVVAVAPGRVVHAGWFKGYGNLVIVDHGEGYHSLVAHLGSMSAAAGEDVAAGARLGTVGDTGSLKGAYLYFEIRENGKPQDPRQWLAP